MSVRNSERVPPRRRKPKRSVWRKTIWPLVKLLSAAAFCVMILCWFANGAYRPIKLYSRESHETRILAKNVSELKRENDDLRRRINYLKTNEGSAQAARKLGWVKPGEITLVLPEDRIR